MVCFLCCLSSFVLLDIGGMDFATFGANYLRWMSKQSQENLADYELKVAFDRRKFPLGVDVLVKAFAAKGVPFLADELPGRFAGVLNIRGVW